MNCHKKMYRTQQGENVYLVVYWGVYRLSLEDGKRKMLFQLRGKGCFSYVFDWQGIICWPTMGKSWSGPVQSDCPQSMKKHPPQHWRCEG